MTLKVPRLLVTVQSSWNTVKKAHIALPGEPHFRGTGHHLPYGITQCYLPPDTSERARLTPAMQAGTRFTYPGGVEGWVDPVDFIAPRLGVELATFRSRVRRPTTAPPRQPLHDIFGLRNSLVMWKVIFFTLSNRCGIWLSVRQLIITRASNH